MRPAILPRFWQNWDVNSLYSLCSLIHSTVSKETIVFIAGFLLTIVPFLGIPHEWRQYTIFGIGVVLILVGYILRRSVYLQRMEKNGERETDSFVETTENLFEDHTLK